MYRSYTAGFCHGIAPLEAVQIPLDTAPVERAVPILPFKPEVGKSERRYIEGAASAMTKQTVAKRLS